MWWWGSGWAGSDDIIIDVYYLKDYSHIVVIVVWLCDELRLLHIP